MSGCGSCALKTNGGCATGGKTCGCNKRSVYNWLADLPEPAYRSIIPVEVSFKQGSRKAYFQCKTNFNTLTGDYVVVEADSGYDIGQITMSGELVKFQLKKKRIKKKLPELPKVIRKANNNDVERLQELRAKEHDALVSARVIARKLDLDMKIGDIEYQGNGKKVTIFYTAENRVDFRQLIKEYAKEFKVKIEMRQIGMRQESSRIGGIGSCGRELCCSTWLHDFKSVSTSAARYQNLSINQTKLTGQCGRLKCCLNYELDTYLEAWKSIPKKVDKIYTEEGTAYLQKTDILRHILIYKYADKPQFYKLNASDVTKIKEMNKEGKKPENLYSLAIREAEDFLEKEEDLVGQIQLKELPKRKRKRRSKPNNSKKPQAKQKNSGEKKSPTNQKKRRRKPSNKQGNNQQQPNSEKKQENKTKQTPSQSQNKRKRYRRKPKNNNNSNDKNTQE